MTIPNTIPNTRRATGRMTHRRTRRRGFTLVEAVFSVMIVGIAAAGISRAVGVGARTQLAAWERVHGLALADEMIAEALTRPAFRGVEPFGPSGAEIGSNSRAIFDDFEDYHGWTSKPPRTQSGAEIDRYSNWRRSCVVEFVDPDNPASVAPGETDAVRLTVRVYHGLRLVAKSSVIRTRAGARTGL